MKARAPSISKYSWVSKKLRRKILNALSAGTMVVLDRHCELQKQGNPPEMWDDEEKRLWDIINEVEHEAAKRIEIALTR